MSTATVRRVRITLEADVVSQHGSVLRLCYGDDGTAMVDTGAEGVTVEDVQPVRTWTDGDVVLSPSGMVWVRDGGRWHTAAPEIGDVPDSVVGSAGDTVLRYQAGGDA